MGRCRGVLLVFLMTVLLGFALAEYLEAGWLTILRAQYPGLSQAVQGTSSTLICVLLLVWVMSGTSPSPLPTGSSAEDWLRGAQPDEQEWFRAFARWFIAARWVAFGVAIVLAIVAVHVAHLLPADAFRPLLITIACLGASNAGYRLLLFRRISPRALLLLQLYGDLGFFIALLHFSGGIENPLSLLMVLHVVIGGTALSRRQCYLVAGVATLLLALLGWAEWQGALVHRSLLVFPHFDAEDGTGHAAHNSYYVLSLVALHSVIFFITALFVSALAERIRHDERQLAGLATGAIASRRLLEQALETTGTGLRVLDAGGRAYWCNAEWLRWFPVDHPSERALSDTPSTREVRIAWGQADTPGAAGRRARVLQLITAPLLSGKGAISQFVELVQDITVRKETEAQAIRAGKLAAVGELAGQVAHEVNNPIAIISAKGRLVLQDRGGEMSTAVADELRKMVEQADRVARITQALLSYCRPSTGRRSPILIHEPVRKAIGMIAERARGRQVHLEERIPAALPRVIANDGEMQQVFLNLLLNALDAMPGGGTLSVGGSQVNGCVEIAVHDSGTGIAPGIRERIFEPFVTTKEDGQGTGLGLSICLGLVRSHGGRMTVVSAVGRGSCFTVSLPAVAPGDPQME